MDRLVARDVAAVDWMVHGLWQGMRIVLRVRRNPGARRYRVSEWVSEWPLHQRVWSTSTTVWFSDRDPRP
jgi:hypothetical protein